MPTDEIAICVKIRDSVGLVGLQRLDGVDIVVLATLRMAGEVEMGKFDKQIVVYVVGFAFAQLGPDVLLRCLESPLALSNKFLGTFVVGKSKVSN